MTTYTIKQCPFCGKKAEVMSSWSNKFFVQCTKCGCQTTNYEKDKTAIAIWNKREEVVHVIGPKNV